MTARPIKSAPKDGSFIRTFHPKLPGKWREGFWRVRCNRWGYAGSSTITERRNQPTHWVPMHETPRD